MTERREAAGRPPRALLPRRNRKRWLIAAAIAACWLALLDMTGSIIGATLLLVLFAVLGLVTVLALRALGVTRDHPWVQQLASRPWRDGQDVLKLALRHLHEVFVITPSGALIAPNVIELRLNPENLRSLGELMEPELISLSAAQVYEDQVAAHGASFAGHGPADVRVIADPSVPLGRYQLRQGQPVDAGYRAGPQFAHPAPDMMAPGPELAYAAPRPAPAAAPPAQAGAHAVYAAPRAVPEGPYRGFEGHDGNTRSHQEASSPEPDRPPARKLPPVTDMPTVTELSRSPVPVLRLVTGGLATETRVSGARAGRGEVELGLPQVPTVSREHARFTFSDEQWWIANLGRNGLTLNGTALVGEQPLSSGDSIRWGLRADALLTKVEID
jgi:FHA domain